MSEKLGVYRSKRNFNKTAEPDGSNVDAAGGNARLKFAVQYHIARRVHFDFRLEWEGVLLSWAVPKGPSYNSRDKRLAVRVEDHPLDYADFEGLIPQGEYGGGTVMLWDEGFWIPDSDPAAGLESGSLKFSLYGRRLKGKWTLVRLKDDEKNWLLIKENDSFVLPNDGIAGFTTGIRSGRTIAGINDAAATAVQKNPFERFDFALAVLGERIPAGDDWLFEVKYDGYRIAAFAEQGKVRLMTRNGHDFTAKFPPVAAAFNQLAAGRAMVLDGEMVVTDEKGRTDFQALQNYLKTGKDRPLTYMAFDILALDGKDLRALPLTERKKTLAGVLEGAPKTLAYSKHVEGNGAQCFEAAAQLGLEGIIGKKADSPYRGGRDKDWIKIKCYRRQEFVVGGYTLSDKKTAGVSSLLLGFYEKDFLTFAGRAGTGLGRRDEKLQDVFKKLLSPAPPFKNPPPAKKGESIFWLKPKLIAEIQFAEWTRETLLRQASFKGLREDKDPKEVVMERAQEKNTAASKNTSKKEDVRFVEGVKITNPQKLIYTQPPVTKLEVAEYYAAVKQRMLPYTAGRVLSVVRCNKGIGGDCFFKKHPVAAGDGVAVIPIANSEGEQSSYFYLENEKGLVTEAQLGTIEFHVWGSRADDLERPDMMVFDLDPDAGMELGQIRQGVRDMKAVLDELSLVSFLKTSGGKGYHVVVPLKPTAGWDAFHDFARKTAEVMESRWPDRYTSNIRKNKRQNKIFIDWVRNGRGATSIAPYSLRARAGARVSMPIAWKELDTVAPDGIDMAAALKRIKKADPWQNFYLIDQQLKF